MKLSIDNIIELKLSEDQKRALSYEIRISCLNCGQVHLAELPKGTLGRDSVCPNCGCTPRQIENDIRKKPEGE